MPSLNSHHFRAYSPDLPSLLQSVLDATCQAANTADAPTWIVGFSVEDASLHDLVPKISQEFQGISEEHDAAIVGCEVSGVMEIQGDTRVWGTVELAKQAEGRGQTVTFTSATIQRSDNGMWHVESGKEQKETR